VRQVVQRGVIGDAGGCGQSLPAPPGLVNIPQPPAQFLVLFREERLLQGSATVTQKLAAHRFLRFPIENFGGSGQLPACRYVIDETLALGDGAPVGARVLLLRRSITASKTPEPTNDMWIPTLQASSRSLSCATFMKLSNT
jgi:hypothetical protein